MLKKFLYEKLETVGPVDFDNFSWKHFMHIISKQRFFITAATIALVLIISKMIQIYVFDLVDTYWILDLIYGLTLITAVYGMVFTDKKNKTK